MRINTRFPVAVHMLALMELNKKEPVTSELMALSVGTNPVVIRQMMVLLKRAGLIESQGGIPGSRLAKPQEEITLLEIYRAVQKQSDTSLFDLHPAPNPMCPIGRNIESALDEPLFVAQTAMENALERFTLKRYYDVYLRKNTLSFHGLNVFLEKNCKYSSYKYKFKIGRCCYVSGNSDSRRKTMKISIMYVSQGGNTEFAAECIQDGILAKYPFIEVQTMDIGSGEMNLDFLTQSDGVIFGSPVYFTSMSWVLKKWFDQSFKIDLSGKVGAAFVTAQSPTGGTDTAIMEIVRHMLAKGMLVCSGAGKERSFQIGAIGLAGQMGQSEKQFETFGAAVAQSVLAQSAAGRV